jgi:hypothetical protein
MGAIVVLLCWAITASFARNLPANQSLEDLFAPVNALFSGLALLGVIIAVLLQKQELEAQRLEIRRSRIAQEQIAEANERRFAFDQSLFAEQLKATIEHRRLDTAFSMHREFNSESLHRSRNLAGGLIAKHPRLSIQEIHARLPIEETVHFSNVTGFYNRLALLIRHEQIDKRFVPELFGRLFVWWWVNLFEGRTSPGWENVERIEDLHRFIQEHTSEDDYQRWMEMARTARKRYLEAADAIASESTET